MTQHVEAALLDVVDEGDEAHTAARVGNHQQDLRPPELDVVLPHIQHQQVLAHLRERRELGRRLLSSIVFIFIPNLLLINPSGLMCHSDSRVCRVEFP